MLKQTKILWPFCWFCICFIFLSNLFPFIKLAYIQCGKLEKSPPTPQKSENLCQVP